MLVEISTERIRAAAAKLPQPKAGKLEKPDSAIDAGIRKSAENHPDGMAPVTTTSELSARVDELLVSAETPPKTPKTDKPTDKPGKTE